MSNQKLFIPIILGTNREGRQSEAPAKFILEKLQEKSLVETELIDVKNFAMPADNYGQAIKDLFPKYREMIVKADGIIIIAPEYNHGYPGILKSVLDTLYSEYAHKAVGLVGVSAGPWGGTRVVESLLPVVRELGLVATETDLNFSLVQNVFDKQGKLLDQAFAERADKFLEELIWMSKTLKWGREHNPSKFRK